jgi:Lon protease-like protein
MNLAATPTLRSADLDALPLFPLPQIVLFPGTALPLHVFEPRYRSLIEYCLESGSSLALPQIEPGHEAEQLGAPPLVRVAGVGAIVHHERLPDGRLGLVLRGLGRVEAIELARRYGSLFSPTFVAGILGAILDGRGGRSRPAAG